MGPSALGRLLTTRANHLQTRNFHLASPAFRFFPFFALHGTGHGDSVADVILESYTAAGQFVFLAAFTDCEFVCLITLLETAGERDWLTFGFFRLLLPGQARKAEQSEDEEHSQQLTDHSFASHVHLN